VAPDFSKQSQSSPDNHGAARMTPLSDAPSSDLLLSNSSQFA
jgi:hypothetical protein